MKKIHERLITLAGVATLGLVVLSTCIGRIYSEVMASQTFQFLSLAWNENMNWLYFGIIILLDFWKMAFVTNHTD
jgi:hypothetical protein